MKDTKMELPDYIMNQLLSEEQRQKLICSAVAGREQTEEDIIKVVSWATNVMKNYNFLLLATSGCVSLHISENGNLVCEPINEPEKFSEALANLPV